MMVTTMTENTIAAKKYHHFAYCIWLFVASPKCFSKKFQLLLFRCLSLHAINSSTLSISAMRRAVSTKCSNSDTKNVIIKYFTNNKHSFESHFAFFSLWKPPSPKCVSARGVHSFILGQSETILKGFISFAYLYLLPANRCGNIRPCRLKNHGYTE